MNDGPINAQPLPFIRVIQIIDESLAECSSIKEEQEKRKAANRSRAGNVK